MRIGIDGSRLGGQSSGIGRYLSGLLAPLDAVMPEAEFFIYTKRRAELQLPSKRWTAQHDASRAASRMPNVLWTRLRLGMIAARDRLDVFWAANTLVPKGLGSTPVVATVYDLNHMLIPQSMSIVNRLSHRLWLAGDLKRAHTVVSISHGTSSRMQAALGRQADFVAQPGIPLAGLTLAPDEIDHALDELAVHCPYLLAVGTREPRKNLAATIEAVAKLKIADAAFTNHRLVLAGGKGWGNDPVSRAAPDWVQPLGYVSDRHLIALYSRAAAFVFPSLYEGYGIPVSEALLFGCPVVATDIPELREAGNSQVVYVSAQAEAIAAGIRLALARPRPTPSRRSHDWESSALVMRDALYGAAVGVRHA